MPGPSVSALHVCACGDVPIILELRQRRDELGWRERPLQDDAFGTSLDAAMLQSAHTRKVPAAPSIHGSRGGVFMSRKQIPLSSPGSGALCAKSYFAPGQESGGRVFAPESNGRRNQPRNATCV